MRDITQWIFTVHFASMNFYCLRINEVLKTTILQFHKQQRSDKNTSEVLDTIYIISFKLCPSPAEVHAFNTH